MSPTRRQLQVSSPIATACLRCNCNYMMFLSGQGWVACLPIGRNSKCRPNCNDKSSMQLQLYGVFGQGWVACLPWGRNCKCLPRPQPHIFDATATLWCFVREEATIACLPLVRNCKCCPWLQLHFFNATTTMWYFNRGRVSCMPPTRPQLHVSPATSWACVGFPLKRKGWSNKVA